MATLDDIVSYGKKDTLDLLLEGKIEPDEFIWRLRATWKQFVKHAPIKSLVFVCQRYGFWAEDTKHGSEFSRDCARIIVGIASGEIRRRQQMEIEGSLHKAPVSLSSKKVRQLE